MVVLLSWIIYDFQVKLKYTSTVLLQTVSNEKIMILKQLYNQCYLLISLNLFVDFAREQITNMKSIH